MKPTLASLKAELQAIKRKLAAMKKWAADAERERAAAIDLAAKYANMAGEMKQAARPIIAYMETQWPGTVGPELRRLKELCR